MEKDLNRENIESLGWTKEGYLKAYSDGMVFLAKEMLSKLTKDQFLEVISDYCPHCGQNEKELGKCYCSPIYDL